MLIDLYYINSNILPKKTSDVHTRPNIEAEEKLIKAGQGVHIDVQLDKLRSNVNKLVIHRETPSIWLANVSSFKGDNNQVSTKRIMTSLPIIYLNQDNLPAPIVRYSEIRKKRVPRKDKHIEDDVYLKSLHAYRYK